MRPGGRAPRRIAALLFFALSFPACGAVGADVRIGGAAPCGAGHLSVADLEAMKPAALPGSYGVRTVKRECTDGELGVSEAQVYFDIATDSPPQEAAKAFLSAARAAGWKQESPAAGTAPKAANGRINLVLTRDGGQGEITLAATVYTALEVKAAGSRGDGLDKVIASGKPTGISAWMWQGPAPGPTLGPIDVGSFEPGTLGIK